MKDYPTKHRPISRRSVRCGLVMAYLLIAPLSAPSLTWASASPATTAIKTETNTQMAKADAKAEKFSQELNALLESERYSKVHYSKKWMPKEQAKKESTKEPSGWQERLFELLEWLSLALGRFGKFVLLALLLLFFAWLFIRYKDTLVRLLDKKPQKKADVSLATLILETEVFAELPEHDALYANAKALLAQGHYLPALSLLYRGTLRRHNVIYDLPITKSQTEAQCQALLATTKRAGDDEKNFFAKLIALWQLLAYGRADARAYVSKIDELLQWFNQLYPAQMSTKAQLKESSDVD